MTTYKETSMPAIFFNQAEKLKDAACVAYKGAKGGYEDISWSSMAEMVSNIGYFLLSQGIQAQNKVALFSDNRYEWWVADLGILSAGAVNVPIYATNSAEESRYIIENSNSVICFVGSKGQLQRVLQVKPKLPDLRNIIVFDEPDKPVEGVITIQEALKQGAAYAKKDELAKRIKNIKEKEMATIIYTSGTTGNPKGVMLSHFNIVSNVRQCYAVTPHLISEEIVGLSFLPLSHSLERTVGYYLPMTYGKKVAFAEDFSKIIDNFKDIRPEFIVSVPRLYEKIHSTIQSRLPQASVFKRKLFAWSQSVSQKSLPYLCTDRKPGGILGLQYKLADKLVFSKIRDGLGMDKLLFAISGGGPLSKSDAEFFLGMGIKVLEGFGMTETTPVTNVNPPDKIKPGTVGPALKDTIVKIGQDGELLIKGPQVMIGYYKNEAATKEMFTPDGFLKTGDIGEIDADGYLKITGRIKDLIITSGGKNISPQNLENSIKASPFIEQVAIIGDNRKYLSALIVPEFKELKSWCKANNVTFSSHAELIANEQVLKLFEKELTSHTKDYARVEQIRKFRLLEHEWSQETDELTPTLKVKRKVINQKYSSEIDSMYSAADDAG